jgi:MFS superfamily sulfate permease-like transporter
LGSSRHLVVGADSATAAIMFAGITSLGVCGLQPATPQWVVLAGLSALLAGGLLWLARVARLGFLADFLSRTVLVGFLTGVGIQVATGQVGGMLQYLPNAVLSSVVFLIGVKLIAVKGMRAIYDLRRDEFWVALLTAATVIVFGVEQGIILAIVLSLIVHLTSSHDLKSWDSRFTPPLPRGRLRGHQRRSAGLRPTGSDGSPRTRDARRPGLASWVLLDVGLHRSPGARTTPGPRPPWRRPRRAGAGGPGGPHDR